MHKARHWTPSELKYLGEPFTPEWRYKRAELSAKIEADGHNSFSDERYQLGRMEYQGYIVRED